MVKHNKTRSKGHHHRRRQRGGNHNNNNNSQMNTYPHASPSMYSDGQSYMLATVGQGDTQWNNVFASNKSDGAGNAIVGLEGQRAGGKRGTRSKTHPGRKNYTTKKGDKVFHRNHHYVRKSRKPYTHTKKRRGGDWGTVINRAIVPFGLWAMQNRYSRKGRKGRK